MAKFEIKNRWSGEVMFSCELSAEVAGKEYSVQLGFAVKKAIEARAYLAGADLAGAYLAGADLEGAYLAGADLEGADLARAYLAGADLAGAKNAELVIARTRILPDGDLIGWKKCVGGVIVKLKIPAEAKRSHAFGRKCRAEFADVLEVFGNDHGVSLRDRKTTYIAGNRITPDGFDDNWQSECSSGIHFYITREEAEAHS